MSTHPRKRRNQHRYGHARRFTVRGIRRNPTDLGKLSRALLGLALAEAEAERQAQADHTARASDIDTSEAASEPQPKSDGGADA